MPYYKSSRSHPESVLTRWPAWPESHCTPGKLASMPFRVGEIENGTRHFFRVDERFVHQQHPGASSETGPRSIRRLKLNRNP